MQLRDLSSLSNPHQVKVTHLDWKVHVSFDAKVLDCEATYALSRVDDAGSKKVGGWWESSSTTTLDLDTAHLIITGIIETETGRYLKYKLHRANPKKPHLGQKLVISLPTPPTPSYDDGAVLGSVTIRYRTTDQCTAVQWLPPSATSGKLYPFLFTQCQAIHARSLVPCQDVPGVKFTYTAEATVPSWSTCVMSAILKSVVDSSPDDDGENEEETETTTTYRWEQTVPIPSYLLAMAIGHLARKELSARCAIWSEPAIVDAAAYEFAQAEDFLKAAESIAGSPYAWGRYDLLCLPPSCPYGGMENPCLTFVTPTLLAGDRSLADVVAHEQAHSWTGNLVTNATWDHFWLNEGWTTWFQRKIMARIHIQGGSNGDAFFDFDAMGGFKMLKDTVDNEMPPEFTRLVLQIGDRDPDDSYSTVAYEKGFCFLYSLEKRVGSKDFGRFFQAYVQKFSYGIVSSEEFKSFFLSFFEGDDKVLDVPWDSWLYGSGMPPEPIGFDTTLAQASEDLAQAWLAVDRNNNDQKAGAPRPATATDISSWSSRQICAFLDALQSHIQQDGGTPLKVRTLAAMNQRYSLSSTKNAEILFRYCLLAIASEDDSILETIVEFITSQGRMKFVRPLYRALHRSTMGKDLAVETFLDNADFYHPICAKMIAHDLAIADVRNKATRSTSTGGARQWSLLKVLGLSAAATGAVAALGVLLLRRSKRS
jgi:leukotriene-A4 hydrolase